MHPPKGGAGLFAVARGAWGLGAVTPTVFGGAGGVQRDQQSTTITLRVLTEAVNFEFGKFYRRID